MATVGSLVVKLSAHIAEFTSGLQTAATQARTTASKISGAFDSAFSSPKSMSRILTGDPGKNLDAIRATLWGIKMPADAVAGSFGQIGLALEKIGRTTVGRAPFALFDAVGIATANLSPLTVGLGIATAGMTALAAAAARFGDEIVRGKEAAIELGITYDEYLRRRGEKRYPGGIETGLESGSGWWKNFKALIGGGIGAAMWSHPNTWIKAYAKQFTDPLAEQERATNAWLKGLGPEEKAAQQQRSSIDAIIKRLKDARDSFGKGPHFQDILNLKALGASPEAIAGVEALIRALEKLDVQRKQMEKTKALNDAAIKDFEQHQESLQNASSKLWLENAKDRQNALNQLIEAGRKLAETPIEKFDQKMEALGAALEHGVITPADYERTATGLERERLFGGKQLSAPSALLQGSKGLVDAIANTGMTTLQNQAVAEARKQTRFQEQMVKQLGQLQVGFIQ